MHSLFGHKKDKDRTPAHASTVPFKKVLPQTPSKGQASPSGGQTGQFAEFGALPAPRSFTVGGPTYRPPTPPTSPRQESPPLLPPKYSFLPTRIPPVTTSSSNSIDSFGYSTDEVTSGRKYGILGEVGARVILSLEDVGQLIQDVGKQLEKRGLATALLFSNQALDVNQTRIKMLIESYMSSLTLRDNGSRTKSSDFAQDIKFAKEHELAWLLRWGLSRITRIREGTRELCHGVLEWEVYEEWRGRERAANYPADAFPSLAALVAETVYSKILHPIFRLLARFAAHSHLSGLTPHSLSSLFAPLLFDIPASSSAMSAHAAYVRAACATEHLLLSHIRSSGSNKTGLGVSDLPARLQEWVRGYPSMVASDADLARGQPRRGARVVRCERASRQVRAYSRDLVVQAELWAQDVPGKWEAWERVVLKNKRGNAARPKFSSDYRKKMLVKDMLPLPASSSELGRKISYGKAARPGTIKGKLDGRPLEEDGDGARWGSLAGKEWSMFEEGGFDAAAGEKKEDIRSKLQFDLSESAKNSLKARRDTMDWTEFASSTGGFNRTDPLLDISLTFSQPIAVSITEWPKERDELRKKLQKSQKEAVPFAYDTTPKVGTEVALDPHARADSTGRVYIEESFVDVWADLMMGGGWMDRDELTFKEANWAVIEYKARPGRPESGSLDPREDPRTSDLYFLFEERVPFEYQMAIADPKMKKTFATLFTPKSKKRTTSQLHALPVTPENDFDRMLMSRSQTRKLTLDSAAPKATVYHMNADPGSPTKPVSPSKTNTSSKTVRPRSRSGVRRDSVEEAKVHEGKASFFGTKTVRRVKTDESQRETARRQRQRETEVDYELHSASGASSGGGSPQEAGHRRVKDEDKWMDILIAHGARRMDRQAALPPPQNLGLPLSPHPPGRSPSPRIHQPSAYHTPETSDESPPVFPRPAAERTESLPMPTTTGFSPSQDVSSENALAAVQQTSSYDESFSPPRSPRPLPLLPSPSSPGNRNPLPPIPRPKSPTHGALPPIPLGAPLPHPTHGALPPIPRNPSPSISQQGELEILSPRPQKSPRGQRDTINDIVGHYAPSHRESYVSDTAYVPGEGGTRDSEIIFEPVDEYEYGSEVGVIQEPSSTTDNGTGSSVTDEGDQISNLNKMNQSGMVGQMNKGEQDEIGKIGQVGNKSVGKGEEALKPPTRVFDLTPGREPSPARYRHGEPLQFVGEEPEEE